MIWIKAGVQALGAVWRHGQEVSLPPRSSRAHLLGLRQVLPGRTQHPQELLGEDWLAQGDWWLSAPASPGSTQAD